MTHRMKVTVVYDASDPTHAVEKVYKPYLFGVTPSQAYTWALEEWCRLCAWNPTDGIPSLDVKSKTRIGDTRWYILACDRGHEVILKVEPELN